MIISHVSVCVHRMAVTHLPWTTEMKYLRMLVVSSESFTVSTKRALLSCCYCYIWQNMQNMQLNWRCCFTIAATEMYTDSVTWFWSLPLRKTALNST